MASAPPVSYISAPSTINSNTTTTVGTNNNALKRNIDDTPPNETLYINNLTERATIKALRTTLYRIFKQYGQVIQVVAHQNTRLRGQAWVVMSSKEQAKKAKDEVNGFPLFDKPMVIKYAKSVSDRIINRFKPNELENHRIQRKAEKATRETVRPRRKSLPLKKKERKENKANNTQAQPSGPLPSSQRPRKVAQIPDEYLPPNNILFVQYLPEGITIQELTALFNQYPAFMEVRMVPTKPDIAFVEFKDETSAGLAKDGLSNFEIKQGSKIKVTYARK